MTDTADLREGDTALILDGPFADFTGPVRSVDHERGRVRLVVLVFGDQTLIDVDLSSVEKASGS
ncbi:KOW motif-containing protein [Actinacidiphila glaucinigra]|uniref:KOW motif-containing protein n=1 Tax=Actinacidiphila glaucinigra TaxID=235986 RepID=UPI00339F3865